MRSIKEIIVHCTDTPEGREVHAVDIARWHKEQGWKTIGYHYVVCLDGLVEVGRPESMVGAHCLGHNTSSIGVVYVGGRGADGKPCDTRTPAQRASLRRLLSSLVKRYQCPVYGHRDFSRKDCPCFDARAEFADLYRAILDEQKKQIEEVFPTSV